MAHPYLQVLPSRPSRAAHAGRRGLLPPWRSSCGAALAAVLLSAVVLLGGCSDRGAGDARAQGAGPGGAMPAMPVTVQSARLESVPVTIEAVGQAEGSKEVELRARVSGLLERKLYEEGERVKAGAPMFQIERAPFEIALQQARANLAQRVAQMEQARGEAEAAGQGAE